MSGKLAMLEVTLPRAHAQHIEQAKRVVTISGSLTDGSQDVAIDFTGPLVIKASLTSIVTVSVQEVLANGKTHAPVSIEITPNAFVEPIPPDVGQFAVKFTGVEDDPT